MSKTDQRVEQALDRIATQVEELSTDEDWKAYLAVQSQFHTYSFGNVLLIASQNPDATHVAGYRKWQELGRQVQRGETGIAILAPVKRTITEEDTDTGEKNRRQIVAGWRTVSVFDVSQTDGDPLPEHPGAELITGDAPAHLWDGLQLQAEELGYTVEIDDMARHGHRGANGVTNGTTQSIVIHDQLPPAQQAKTLAHELAHARQFSEGRIEAISRSQAEVEAESVAFIVCESQGVKTDAYTFPYVTGWSGGDASKVRAAGEQISKCAQSIIDTYTDYLDRTLDHDLETPQPEPEPAGLSR